MKCQRGKYEPTKDQVHTIVYIALRFLNERLTSHILKRNVTLMVIYIC